MHWRSKPHAAAPKRRTRPFLAVAQHLVAQCYSMGDTASLDSRPHPQWARLPWREQMKPVWGLILVLSTTAGCAEMATTQSDQASDPSNTTKSNQRSNKSSSHASAWPDPEPMFPANMWPQPVLPATGNTGPQPVLPTTGGPPVIGIPIGGNIYLPVTGGPPVVGIPLFP